MEFTTDSKTESSSDSDSAKDVGEEGSEAAVSATPRAGLVDLVAKEVLRRRENDTKATVLKKSMLKQKLCPKMFKTCAYLSQKRQKERDYYSDYEDYFKQSKPKKPGSPHKKKRRLTKAQKKNALGELWQSSRLSFVDH